MQFEHTAPHWEGCWQQHLPCALTKIADQQNRLQAIHDNCWHGWTPQSDMELQYEAMRYRLNETLAECEALKQQLEGLLKAAEHTD